MILIIFDIVVIIFVIYYVSVWRHLNALIKKTEAQWQVVLKFDNKRLEILRSLNERQIDSFPKIEQSYKMTYFYKPEHASKHTDKNKIALNEELRIVENRLLFECSDYNKQVEKLVKALDVGINKLVFYLAKFRVEKRIILPRNDTVKLD